MYNFIQSALTATIEFATIAGFAAIIAHAFYKQTVEWVEINCPPVKSYTPEVKTEAPVKTECKINPNAYWETTSPDGSAWEIASPLTCEWVAPVKPKRQRSTKKATTPKTEKATTTRKRKVA